MLDQMTKQMAEREKITEQLIAKDQMTWVGVMNSFKARPDEIVGVKLIYN